MQAQFGAFSGRKMRLLAITQMMMVTSLELLKICALRCSRLAA